MAQQETQPADAGKTEKKMGAEPAKPEKKGRPDPVKAAKPKIVREKLKKQLPTDRIKVDKQLEIVRAFAAASGNDRAPITSKDAAAVVALSENTLSMATPFFVDVGFLARDESNYVPSIEVLEFKRALDLDDPNAAQRLAPVLRKAWFFEILRPRLEFQGIAEQAALTELGMAAGADKSDMARVRPLIDFLVGVGLVHRDNGLLKMTRAGQTREEKTDEGSGKRDPETPKKKFRSSNDEAGAFTVNFSIDVGVTELSTWEPSRIAAFMDGMTRIINAKKGLEENKP